MTLDDLRALAETADAGKTHRFPDPYAQMAITLEEGDFLYALVRMLKPARVLELGTGHGVSAKFIAGALAANGYGDLLTVEPDAELRKAARAMLAGSLRAEVVEDPSEDPSAGDFELVFVDSGYQRRADDIVFWLTEAPSGPIVVVHDAGRGYDELRFGLGVLLPSVDGMWIGRAR